MGGSLVFVRVEVLWVGKRNFVRLRFNRPLSVLSFTDTEGPLAVEEARTHRGCLSTYSSINACHGGIDAVVVLSGEPFSLCGRRNQESRMFSWRFSFMKL